MRVLDELQKLKSADLKDADGEALELNFLRGLDPDKLREIEGRLGAPLPQDYRILAAECGRIDGVGPEVDLAGDMAFEMAEVFPHGLAFAHDGCGNFWVVDALSKPEAEATVFFACHDAPVILYQCTGMATFLASLLDQATNPGKSILDEVQADELFHIWRTNPGTLDQPAAFRSVDEPIRNFASSLDERFQIVDLRTPKTGFGFSWGRYGPGTELRRHGEERIFACAKPPSKPGFFSKLFKSS